MLVCRHVSVPFHFLLIVALASSVGGEWELCDGKDTCDVSVSESVRSSSMLQNRFRNVENIMVGPQRNLNAAFSDEQAEVHSRNSLGGVQKVLLQNSLAQTRGQEAVAQRMFLHESRS